MNCRGLLNKYIVTLLTMFLTTTVACFSESSISNNSEKKDILQLSKSEKEEWQVEWQTTLSMAKKEGRVVLYGPPGTDARIALTEGFEKAYPYIRLEYVAATGANIAPRILGERRGGIYLVDIHMGGTITILSSLKSLAAPIEPLIILPEARDTGAWVGGKFDFSDNEGKFNLVFTNSVKIPVLYNTQIVEHSKLKGASYWEFTKPEWKGKVLLTDPRTAGPGLGGATFYYSTPELGLEFMKSLAKNGVILHRDQRLMAEWVGRGKYPVQLGPSELESRSLQRGGLPLDYVVDLKESSYISAAFGSVIFMDKAPHPNTGKVFLNWLLTRDGQTTWSKVSGYPSRRLDIPTDHLDPLTIPKPGTKYIYIYKEAQVETGNTIGDLIKEIFRD